MMSIMSTATSNPEVTAELIRNRIADINWFHQIDLGHGVVTPGDCDSQRKLAGFHLPEDLTGKTFLDVGAWDGFFSFEAERRGASRVLATDSFVWRGNVPGKSKAGFLAARELLNSRVEDMEIEPLAISPETVGMWDVVLFARVLYHMEHPLLALQRVSSVTKELLIVETATDFEFKRRPAVAFYPGSELALDSTNWFGPNTAAVLAMLRHCGFRQLTVVYKKPLYRRILAAGQYLFRFRQWPWTTVQQGRVAVHARR
jgi:tRNA (mo5U34)-methyltransferase